MTRLAQCSGGSAFIESGFFNSETRWSFIQAMKSSLFLPAYG